MRTHYDWTTLSCLARCEQEFVFRYVHHLGGPPTASQLAGLALHAGLKAFFAGEPAEPVVRAVWGAVVFPAKPALTAERLCAILRCYMAANPVERDPWTVEANEQYVEHPSEPWCGILDRRLRRKDDGRLAVMDTKTTSMNLSAAWGAQWAYSGQLALQCDLVEAQTGEPCTEAWVDGIFLSWRKEGPKAEDFQRFGPFPYPESLRGPLREERRRLVARAQQLTASVDAEPRRNGAYSGACFAYNNNCAFQRFCALPLSDLADEVALGLAVGTLEERPWRPEERG